jgi:putative DNA primase/helicase
LWDRLSLYSDNLIVGVDLDKCRSLETGKIEDGALEIVQELKISTEVSPSGTGLHVFVQGHLTPGSRRKGQVGPNPPQ